MYIGRLLAVAALSGGLIGYGLAVSSLEPPSRVVDIPLLPPHAMMSTATWTEKDFQVLLGWERDGIFPRIYGDGSAPAWYLAEKQRRGIVVTPERIVTPEQFNDPQFRMRETNR